MRAADVNDFLEQFLIKSRELVEQATSDLLALEDRPDDKEHLDSAFRAIHTLKGAAAIVEFAPMGRAMHAAEDVLSGVREGADFVTAELIGNCLSSLDQVVQWLNSMEATQEQPSAAEAQADAIVARFGKAEPHAGVADEAAAKADSWVDEILAQYPDAAKNARTAIRFAPAADSFFKGEDPLARVAAIPSLLALNISGKEGWPALDDFDPFRCQMIITALLAVAADEAATIFEAVTGQVETRDLKSSSVSTQLSSAARALIEAQIQLLSETASDGFFGRLASAGRVAAAVCAATAEKKMPPQSNGFRHKVSTRKIPRL